MVIKTYPTVVTMSRWEDDRRILTVTWRQSMCIKGEFPGEIRVMQVREDPTVIAILQDEDDHWLSPLT